MKTLSIKQPWASLICTPRNDNPNLGIKDIENRTWKTNYRGKILIHASGSWFKYPKKEETLGDLFSESQWEEIRENYQKNLYSILDPKAITDRLPTSAIIGEVEIIDCVINHESIWAEKSEFQCCGIFPTNDCNPCGHFKSEKSKGIKPIYNWVLANPVLYENPILNVKGKLMFWEFEK